MGWRPLPGDRGTFFVTADRTVVVEVAIPDDYAPEADVLVDLAPAVGGVPSSGDADSTGGAG